MPESNGTIEVPEDLRQIWNEAKGANKLRDVYARMPFGFKKSLKAATHSIRLQDQFWTLLRKLHPNLPRSIELDINSDPWRVGQLGFIKAEQEKSDA